MTTATAAPPSVGLIGNLLLARLLTAGRSRTDRNKLRLSLSPPLPEPLTTGQFAALLAELRAAGLVDPKRSQLTESGRAQALAFLGVEDLPAKIKWDAVKTRYLVPMALGVTPGDRAALRKATSLDGLAVRILKAEHELPIGSTATLNQAVEALVCRLLGHPEAATKQGLFDLMAARFLGFDVPLNGKQVNKLIPQKLAEGRTGRQTKAALQKRAFADWVASQNPEFPVETPEPIGEVPAAALESSLTAEEVAEFLDAEADGDGLPSTTRMAAVPEAESPAEFDLPAFANTVLRAARDATDGRFGDDKVFVSRVWDKLRGEAPFAGMDLAGFKARLVEANAARLLDLSRADLPFLMDGEDVRESEIPDGAASYHFVRTGMREPDGRD